VAFKPYFGRVLIKAETFLDKVGQLKALKAAGFQLPDTVKERDLPQWGKVVAVGSTADASIAIGTRVLFGKYAGHKLEGSEDLYVVQDADIIGADVGECEPEGVKEVEAGLLVWAEKRLADIGPSFDTAFFANDRGQAVAAVTLCSAGLKPEGEAAPGYATRDEAVEHWKKSFLNYINEHPGTFYWRVKPEIRKLDGKWRVRARFGIAPYPVDKCEVTGVPVKGPFATLSDLYNDRTEGAA
jgi:co-chaperonin GroES (HSP10)